VRLAGRITVYGEHLMDGDAFGLIAPSALYLADDKDNDAPTHTNYDPSRDSVRAMLQRDGFPTCKNIRGNLPFGYGFASSSALALIHLRDLIPSASIDIVDRLDASIHGFRPSGVDSQFHVRQRGGLYRNGEWIEVPDLELRWSCALLRKERRWTLPEARERIRQRRIGLSRLADKLSTHLLDRGFLSCELLLEYAVELFRTGAYSGQARQVINLALSQDIVAKGIGGVYDKAILFLERSNSCDRETGSTKELMEAVRRLPGSRWIESV
jgi:hypothetical protein